MNTMDIARGALVVVVCFLALCAGEEERKRQFGADDSSFGFGNGLAKSGGDGKLQNWQSYFAKRMGIKRGLGSTEYKFGANPWADARLQDWKNYFARSARFNGVHNSAPGFGQTDLNEGAGKFQTWNGLFKRAAEETDKH